MAICTDKALIYLNEKGYNVVRLPRKGIAPLDVLGRDGKSVEWLGRLDQLWTSRQPIPKIGDPQPASHINGQKTSEMSLSIGLKLLSSVLGAIGAKVPDLSFAYNEADSLAFVFGNVSSRSVTPLEVGNFLANGDLQSKNPFVVRYLVDDDTEAFVITEILESNEITVSAKDSMGGNVTITAPSIQNVIGADVTVAAKASSNAGLTYTGKDSITFGFKAFAIAFDGRWHVRGVQPSEALAFSPDLSSGPDPVILRKGMLALR
jgi:hypothetical protein